MKWTKMLRFKKRQRALGILTVSSVEEHSSIFASGLCTMVERRVPAMLVFV